MLESSAPAVVVGRPTCPPWCVTRHGVHTGEEDWVHHGEPVPLDDTTSAQLCMSIDPRTGAEDGPYVLIGGREYALPEVRRLSARLAALAGDAGDSSPAVPPA